VATASDVNRLRQLLVHEFVRPALYLTPIEVGGQLAASGIEHEVDAQTVVPFANAVGLTKDLNGPLDAHAPNEDHPTRGAG
jgi:hypothetical protein